MSAYKANSGENVRVLWAVVLARKE
jgi:hypothetical protein